MSAKVISGADVIAWLSTGALADGMTPIDRITFLKMAEMLAPLADCEVPVQSREPGTIPMPTNADEAVAMVLLGESWLRHNAPERLKQPSEGGP